MKKRSFGSGRFESVDGCLAVKVVKGLGKEGKEMKIRYVFILLIIIVLALFKKMAD